MAGFPSTNECPSSSTGFAAYAARGLLGLVYSIVLVGVAPVAVPFALVAWAFATVSDAMRSSDSWDGRYRQKFVHGLGCATRWSEYLTTSDGTRLAVDVWLPVRRCGCAGVGICGGSASDHDEAFPVILHQARYYRSIIFRWPLSLFLNNGKPVNLIQNDLFAEYVARGMAVVSVDIRGTGASFGRFTKPWSPAERSDGVEVLEWVLEQPWCSGRIGLYGGSYEGTSAFLLGLRGHPAVLACTTMFPFWDIYRDIARPGSFLQHNFLGKWHFANNKLDIGSLPEDVMKLIFETVNPAEDRGTLTPRARGVEATSRCGEWAWNPAILQHPTGHTASSASVADLIGEKEPTPKDDVFVYRAKAQRQHVHNMDVVREMVEDLNFLDYHQVTITDDPLTCIERLNPHADVARKRSHTTSEEGQRRPEALPAFFFLSGWLDQTAMACLKMAFHTPSALSYCCMGPWNHGGLQHVRFFPGGGGTGPSQFPFEAETADFFEAFLMNDLPPRVKERSLPRTSAEATSEATLASAGEQGNLGMPSDIQMIRLRPKNELQREAGFQAHEPKGGTSPASWTPEERQYWMAQGAAAFRRPKMRYFKMQAEEWVHAAEWPVNCEESRSCTFLLGQATTSELPAGTAGPLVQRKDMPAWRPTSENAAANGDAPADPCNGAGPEAAFVELHVDPRVDEPFAAPTNDRYSTMIEQMDLMKYNTSEVLQNSATMVFMGPVLEQDLEVTGVPIISLVVSSPDCGDAPLFAYLLAYAGEVDSPRFQYVTEGYLRSGCRRVHPSSPQESAGDASKTPESFRRGAQGVDIGTLPGVPLPTFQVSDVEYLEAGHPARVSFPLLPTSYLFRAGQGLALMVAGADAGQFDCKPFERPPHGDRPSLRDRAWTLRVHTSTGEGTGEENVASYVQLPVSS